jgi:hypothetical protein
MIEKEIEALRDIATPAVQAAIHAYSNWMVISSIGWIASGVAIVVAATKCLEWWRSHEFDDDGAFVASLVGIVLLFLIGGLLVVCNLPDLFSPQAAAIHQVLRDIRVRN